MHKYRKPFQTDQNYVYIKKKLEYTFRLGTFASVMGWSPIGNVRGKIRLSYLTQLDFAECYKEQ